MGVYPYISAILFLFSATRNLKGVVSQGVWEVFISFKLFLYFFLIDQYSCCLCMYRNLASFRPGKSKVIKACTEVNQNKLKKTRLLAFHVT